MRVIIFILILAVVALLVAVGTGYLDISQTRQAKPPEISATTKGVVARGGQTPAFDVETGTVSVGRRTTNVQVPTVRVNQPGTANSEASNVAANAG